MSEINNIHEQIPLGKSTEYQSHYNPALLAPIPRGLSRRTLAACQREMFGEDLWTAYEMSWLKPGGVPVVAVMRCHVPSTSTHIIESKSFKLYLNSYNGSEFDSFKAVEQQLKADLSAAAGESVSVVLERLDAAETSLQVGALAGIDCVDDLAITVTQYEPDASLLAVDDSMLVEEALCSHLLKSNCPVTSQPDWASVIIRYKGPQIVPESFLAYVISFREHQDFHEHCVERMYVDLMNRFNFDYLDVVARYTRRGGLDINPFRSSRADAPRIETRLVRQ
ncbi:NADPH-dependent 7-cyano-7-deazaguanine reductase QueF [uncultured Umboniibacter sp.]|uniref:NADPH-dependent 7-cyano-7-deazaguanine reductase QueF n=1 Tax=uncultured Umboniibacter sp. TaxID=1798917 RepID=UPI002625F3B8|nr:NADPH-dependent 7-cyano-7-deazaguanine reductase QueF [uncultured Umboniibacter sp.]